MTETCASCGALLDPGRLECFACGATNGTLPSTPVSSVSSVRTQPRKTNKTHSSNRGTVTRAREANPFPPAEEPAPVDYLAGLRNGAWLDDQEFAPLTWAVPGLLPEGLTLLVGPPKAGKSWVLTGCLLAVACGGHALGQIPCTGTRRALNLAFEDGDRRQQSRCRELMGRDPIPPRYDYLTRLVAPGTVLPTIAAYLDRHEDTGIIAVDTLGKVMPDARNGETTYSRDYRIGSALKAAADSREGLAVVAVHHDRKAGTEDFVESVSGTNGLAGAADTIIVFRRQRQSAEGLLLVTGRDVIEAEYAIKQVQGAWVLDGRTLAEAAKRAKQRKDDNELGDKSRKILDFIEEHNEGVRAKDVADQFGPDAHMYLKRLLEAGRIDKVERGIYIGRAPEWEAAS